MRVNKIRCTECGKDTNSKHPYCIHCFTPIYTRLPDNTPYGAIAFIIIVGVIMIAVSVANIVYYIFK